MPEIATTKYRITSIDFLRGLVMIIMALDHVRDFFHIEAMTDDPTNLATTTPALFFTRWITHFCAPAFVFLAGTSAFLSGQKKTKKQLSLFLIKRGIWLVFIEAVIITFAWTFNPVYTTIVLQVIWAIGMSMILLGLLVWLPFPLILLTGLLIVFGHNALDYPEANYQGQENILWKILHTPGGNFLQKVSSNHFILFYYAFPVWAGVMITGYCFGKIYQQTVLPAQRKKILIVLGLSATLLFIVLRFINHYGDPAPWQPQKNSLYTFLSFLNTSKYPPSLLYQLMTLGPSILLLAFFEHLHSRFARIVITYGRVPFFYYVLHLYLIHLLCVAVFFASGYSAHDIISPQTPFFFRPLHFGFDLWVVYIIWLMVVILLYPLCKWYNQYKSTHQQWWLSYL